MSDVLQVHKEAMIDFAKFALAKQDELEPWSRSYRQEMHPSPSAFGAVSSDTVDVQYEYMPLTTAEFEKHRGVVLDPAYDPGPEFVQAFGTTTSDVAAWLADHGHKFNLSGLLLDWLMDDDIGDKVANWLDYYSCRGPATIVFPPNGEPTDAPWAGKLHSDWCDAVNNRAYEVNQIRNEIHFVVPLLAVAADEYADTDLYNAVGIESPMDSDESFARG